MADLDQGGIARRFVNERMGPSVGLTPAPTRSVLPITIAGSYTIDLSITAVMVNVAGSVTITLPSLKDPSVPAITIPGGYVKSSVRVEDIGGHALANPITIAAFAGEQIAGASSATISANYGSLLLDPNNSTLNWIPL